MTRIVRLLFPVLSVFLLLMSCSTAGASGTNGGARQSPTAFVVQSPTPLPPKTAADICPEPLRTISTCVTPHAMRVAYGIDSLLQQGFTGKGQTIIDIVSFGSPTLQKDMDVFNKAFNLPPIDLQVISPLNVPESDPFGDKAGWAQETELDVQIIHALAPEARVVILTSPVAETEGTVGLPEFRQLEQYAIDHNLGNIVSQSWGASELTLQDAKGQQELQKWDDLFHKGTTQQHMTYFASSGDEGATDFADDQHHLAKVPTTSFAADSPWVTSVGGTTLVRTNNAIHESAWMDNGGGSGSGGGFSRFYQEPSYQQKLPGFVQHQLNNRRGVPDVAADADPNTGLAIYLDGQWTLAGGTSASSPVWAGIMAIANQKAGRPLGFIDPALYQIGTSRTYHQDFRDITQGNNTNRVAKVQGYPAIQGWDPVTGLGAPNAEKLIPDLIAISK